MELEQHSGFVLFGEGILGFVTAGHLLVRATVALALALAMLLLAQDAATTAGLELR
jgi:hypothetical protein